MKTLPDTLKLNLLLTDLGFLTYWLVTSVALLPHAWLFKDYDDPLLQAWNWSFAPLDLFASVIGLTGVVVAGRAGDWRPYVLVSASLTFCAGLMALSFWTLRADFDAAWWAPNLYLAMWPMFYVRQLARAA
jgi:hypothetical protein